jgi:CRP-like cAMP-binding protein
MDISTLLRRSEWTHLDDEPDLDVLASYLTPRVVPRGTRMLEQGCAERWLGVVAEGEVEVVQQVLGGNERMLRILGPGRTFGELSMLDARPRSASVDALVDSTVLVLDVAELEQMAAENPAVAFRLAMWLAKTVSGRFRANEDAATW